MIFQVRILYPIRRKNAPIRHQISQEMKVTKVFSTGYSPLQCVDRRQFRV